MLSLLQPQPPPVPFDQPSPEHPWNGWPQPGYLLPGVALAAGALGIFLGVVLLRVSIRRGLPRAHAMLLWPVVAVAAGFALHAAGLFWGVAGFFSLGLMLGPWPFVDDHGR